MGRSGGHVLGEDDNDAMHLASRLSKEILDHPATPDPEKCIDLLKVMTNLTVSLALLESSKIGKLLSKATRALKRHHRTASNNEESKMWQTALTMATTLLEKWKSAASDEEKSKKVMKTKDTNGPGLPKTVAEYRTRLVTQKKELFKDPPVLPPMRIRVEPTKSAPPKRDKKTGALSFMSGEDSSIDNLLKDFHPNRTPEEVLRAGSFGGTYFRSISSAVTNVHYNSQDVLRETIPKEWIVGLPMSSLTSATYKSHVNKYGVKCGGSLGMWESSGWIVECDPYGWFQWYCRFYQGRRCSDDSRQISRWMKSAGPKGRFRSQLCNKIIGSKATFDDSSISPVIRQTLLHWGLEITEDILAKHRRRVS